MVRACARWRCAVFSVFGFLLPDAPRIAAGVALGLAVSAQRATSGQTVWTRVGWCVSATYALSVALVVLTVAMTLFDWQFGPFVTDHPPLVGCRVCCDTVGPYGDVDDSLDACACTARRV